MITLYCCPRLLGVTDNNGYGSMFLMRPRRRAASYPIIDDGGTIGDSERITLTLFGNTG